MMTTGAFSGNVGKLFSELKLVTEPLWLVWGQLLRIDPSKRYKLFIPLLLFWKTEVIVTVKPLKWTLQKADNLCTADGSLASDWFYHSTNTFWTSKKQTLLNSEQRTLIRPPRTFKITTENGQQSYTHIMQTVVHCFRNATVTGFKDQALYNLALLLILPFSSAKSNGEVWKCDFITFNGLLITHYHTYQKLTDCL